ncbi:bile acid:sodium symporter family protein [Kangiella sp. HZ709]|uniref:bile acid:sodium symporter family protein n=1 Tax=Kangiella sp. HZ709 TaxID=2666328 RepID=UPI0012AF8BB8|nr:bile acid:sodium symporter family protein [Kangiella sp. HZ709]MRX28555.1 bile acid:sodium symporter family protein [Kangiella sp. HZ709]
MQETILTTIFLPSALFIIMLGMGLSLTLADFKRLWLYPKAITLGLVGQILLLPLCGLLIIQIFNLPPELAVGIMILAACPGGTTSNLISYLAKGDMALSISLTAISSLLTTLTIPIIVSMSLVFFMQAEKSIELPIFKTISTLFMVTILPVIIGMLIKRKVPKFASRQEKMVTIFSICFMTLLVIGIIFQQRSVILDAILELGLSTLSLNLLTMLAGFSIAKAFALNSKQTLTISIEIGVQNATLAFLVAFTLLQQSNLAIPAAIYSLAMYLTSAIIITLSYRKKHIRYASKE